MGNEGWEAVGPDQVGHLGRKDSLGSCPRQGERPKGVLNTSGWCFDHSSSCPMGSRFKAGVGTDRRGLREKAVSWVYSSRGRGGTTDFRAQEAPHPRGTPSPRGC